MRKAVNPAIDREEAFVSLPADRKTRNFRGEVDKDYSTPELEREGDLFPIQLAMDRGLAYEKWTDAYKKISDDHWELWLKFRDQVVDKFKEYQVPVITMHKTTPKEAVCQVFEKVNTGGVSLTVFELLTATFAADDQGNRKVERLG